MSVLQTYDPTAKAPPNGKHTIQRRMHSPNGKRTTQRQTHLPKNQCSIPLVSALHQYSASKHVACRWMVALTSSNTNLGSNNQNANPTAKVPSNGKGIRPTAKAPSNVKRIRP